jgi:hypothetical protein
VPFFASQGALGLALHLHSAGYLEFESIFQTTLTMVGEWMEGKVIDDKYLLELSKKLTASSPLVEEKRKIVEDVFQKLKDM